MNGRTIIVVGVDYETDGSVAFDAAALFAGTQRACEVHVVHVARAFRSIPPGGRYQGSLTSVAVSEAALEKLEGFCKERMAVLQAKQPKLWFERVATHFRTGNPAQQIVQLAVDLDADLIVVGSHNKQGVKRLVLGSVSERVVQTARCPVYVARPKDHMELGDVPEIEPPCPECIETRRLTARAELWCARHELAKYRPRFHLVAPGPAPHDNAPWSHSTPEV